MDLTGRRVGEYLVGPELGRGAFDQRPGGLAGGQRQTAREIAVSDPRRQRGTECHGGALEGDGMRTPALLPMMDLYTPEELGAFFASGTAKGGRELRLMRDVARGRLRHLRPDEVAALHAYLSSLTAPTGTSSPPPPPPAPAP